MNRFACILIATLAAVGILDRPAGAQCPVDWIPTDGFPGSGINPGVFAVTSWDPDGAGSAPARFVAAGQFQYMSNRIADCIAVLNPQTGGWEDLAGGVDAIEKSEKGTIDGAFVTALAVYQDELIAGGLIADAGGVPVNNIARWDGTSWAPLGNGLLGFTTSMTVYNGELIAAGNFLSTGSGTTVNRIARWNGSDWLPLGSPAGMNGAVNDVTVYNGELIAVGNFTAAGGVPATRIARWNGSQWQALEPTGLNAGGFDMAVLGDDLYVCGNFTLAGGVPNTRGVARWDGSTWHAVGGGPLNGVGALTAYQGDIVAAGVFILTVGGEQSIGVARFDTDSQTWGGMDGGFQLGAEPNELTVHNFGGGEELVAAGSFRWAGSISAYGIARWRDKTQTWDRFAPGFDWTPSHFTTYRGDLIAGGVFDSAGDADARGVARWDGEAWHALGGGIGHLPLPAVDSLAVYNDELYVGGHFHFADGGDLPVLHIAKWNGDTETWSDVGGGVSGAELPRIQALVVYNGELVAGGDFAFAGGVPCNNIARWNGLQWQPLAGGFNGIIYSMIEFQGDLIVAGTGLVGMRRWDGSAWHDVTGQGNTFDMAIYNGQLIAGGQLVYAWDGPGSVWTLVPGYSFDLKGSGSIISDYEVFNGELIVAGEFENAAGIPEADGLVRFDGKSWHSLDTGNGTLASITSGLGVYNGELITNGRIEHPDGTMSNWRRWGPTCPPAPSADLNGDGTVDGFDLALLLGHWGGCPKPPGKCSADLDGDGTINGIDLAILLGAWG